MSEKKEGRRQSHTERLAAIVEENQRRREQRQFLEDLGKRISIARQGRMAFEKGELSEAVNCYRRFLNITARSLNSELKNMNPKMFDEPNRESESLLVSAISLDLVKILDQLEGESSVQERGLFLRLFINFTVGRSYQGFAAENLRKYIAYSKSLRNKEEFRAAYEAIRIRRACFLATAAFESPDAPELERLRIFRERYLRTNPAGRLFVRAYYGVSPPMAGILKRSGTLRKLTRYAIRSVLRMF